jgi:parvulin-like peptidyl-prolyl isomerase
VDGYAAASVKRGILSGRNLAIGAGVLLLVMVAIVAVAVGVGHPSVPSDDVAVVDADIDVPGLTENGHITKAGFDKLLLSTAKQSGAQQVPSPSDPQYEQLKQQTMSTALDMTWITGEAERQDAVPTETEVQQALQQLKGQFKNQQAYEQARDQAGLTEEQVVERARLQAISNKIQSKVTDSVPDPSDDDVQSYYDANKEQFTQPAQRTIRVIQNQDPKQVDAAIQALKADDSDKSWQAVAAKYSTDPTSKDKGGLRSNVVPGSFQQPLDDDIFNAPLHEVQGPIATSTGTYAFEVESATEEKTQPIDSVKTQLVQQLKSQNQQNVFSAFVSDYRSYWTSLTTCGDDYIVLGCNNYNKNPNPCPDPTLPDAQQQAQLQQGCPPPVNSTSPAAPGSIVPFQSSSAGAPQRPHPPGATTSSASPGAGGAIPGITGASGATGAAPTGAAPTGQ